MLSTRGAQRLPHLSSSTQLQACLMLRPTGDTVYVGRYLASGADTASLCVKGSNK